AAPRVAGPRARAGRSRRRGPRRPRRRPGRAGPRRGHALSLRRHRRRDLCCGRRRGTMSVAIYPGSFDPMTNGHLSIVKSGLVCFDRLVVAVLKNPRKDALFTVDERVEMIRAELANEPKIEVDSFDGLLVDYCRKKNARVVLRGLRAVADFEYELQM